MIITAITIENFKSIKEPVRLELKPITLLYGPNSVGKSTIIQAFHYAREIMEGAGPDAIYSETGGKAVRLGGFSNLVHNRDIKNAIRFKFEFSSDNLGCVDDYGIEFTVEEQLDKHQEYFQKITEYYEDQLYNKNPPWVEITIRQDGTNELPYVSEAIGFGEIEFIRLTENVSRENRWGQSRYYNLFVHLDSPLFCHDGEKNLAISLFGGSDIDSNDPGDKQGSIFVKKRTPHGRTYNTFLDIDCYCRTSGEQGDTFERLDSVLQENDKPLFEKFNSIINAVWGTHIYYLGYELRNFRYIGPLRERPDHDFRPKSVNSPDRWANGLAAWDYMSRDDDNIDVINKWLSPDYLDSGYKVVKNDYTQINITSKLYADLTGPIDAPEHAVAVSQLQQESVTSRLFLRDINNNNTELLPTDVGVGISQVLPIIPLALINKHGVRGMIAIEQPELHIHPAMQTTLGDLFIEGLDEEKANQSGVKRFLLETHSEHILLRLLRRIRENNDGAFEKDFGPDEISIYFLEPGKNGIKATRIRVNEEGEFKDPWPRGFFNERVEELF